jgi:hypothetical protein
MEHCVALSHLTVSMLSIPARLLASRCTIVYPLPAGMLSSPRSADTARTIVRELPAAAQTTDLSIRAADLLGKEESNFMMKPAYSLETAAAANMAPYVRKLSCPYVTTRPLPMYAAVPTSTLSLSATSGNALLLIGNTCSDPL